MGRRFPKAACAGSIPAEAPQMIRIRARADRSAHLDSMARLGLVVVMAGALLSCGSRTSPRTAATATPLISRGVPVFASSQVYPATNANDGDYSTVWRGSIPGWIAYDLSRVPAARRQRVIVAWFNDPITSPYDTRSSASRRTTASATTPSRRTPRAGVPPHRPAAGSRSQPSAITTTTRASTSSI